MTFTIALVALTAWLVVPHMIDDIATWRWLIPVQALGVLLACIVYTTGVPPDDPNHMTGYDWLIGIIALVFLYLLATKGD
jgi:hypothetical protein